MVVSSLAVGFHTSRPGPQRLVAPMTHVVRVHVGPPARGACRGLGRRVYARGEIDVFPHGSACDWEDTDAATVVRIDLAPALIASVARDLGADPARAQLRARHKFRDPRIERLALALVELPIDEDPSARLIRDSLGVALTAQLLTGDAARAPGRVDARLRARIDDLIEANLDRRLTIGWLARELAMSETHLKRRFVATVGVPLHAHIVHRRVARARTLLLATERSLLEIALAAGFAHPSHMARWMRRELGVTPAQLRGG